MSAETKWRLAPAGISSYTPVVDVLDADDRLLFDAPDIKTATRVVRAVNAHDAMCKALGALVEDYERLAGDGMTAASEPEVLRNARAALAQARGEG